MSTSSTQEIENYLKETAKIGAEASANYASQFVKKGIDTVTVMKTIDINELKKIMEDIGVSKTSKELLSDLDSVIKKLNIVEESCTKGSYSSNAELIDTISYSGASKAVHFVTDEKFGNRGARQFLDHKQSAKQFGDLPLTSTPAIRYNEETFTNSGEHSLFEKLRDTGGSSSAASAKVGGFYGGFVGAASLATANSTQNHSASTISDQVITNHVFNEKNLVISMNSFTLSPSKFVLKGDALNELKAISNVEMASDFLHQYGTHILLTDHTTGGAFIQTTDISFSANVNKTQVENAISKSSQKSGSLSLSYGFIGGSTGVATSSNCENAKFTDSLSSGETYNCNVTFKTVTTVGSSSDLSTFKVALGSSNMTHCLISNGFDPSAPSTWSYTPIWKVAANNLELMENSKSVPKLLREAWLTMVIGQKKNLENFMISTVERCLNEPLADDSQDWNSSWKVKLETCKNKARVMIGDSSTNYTNWNDGAERELCFLDRQNVQAKEGSVMLGFHLERDGGNIRYKIQSSTLGAEYGKVSLKNTQEDTTNWQDGAVKELAYLDRHQIKARDNHVLTGFTLQRSGDNIRYKYQTAQVYLDNDLVPLVDEQVHYSSWEEGADRKEPCFLDRQNISVPSGRVLTGFNVERQGWQIRYKFLSRHFAK